MSIILRYLTRQVLISMLAVSGILLLVFMSGRFIKYLAQAASGQLSGDVLFLIMAYRFPGFLELILPLGLFIGILLAYGRMYLDSEMSVLYACGVSERRIVMHTMVSASVVMLLVGAMSLHFSPWGMQQVQRIFTEQARMTEFEMLTPGRFQSLRSGERVTYTEALSEDRRVLSNVFIAEPGREGRPPVLIRARSGSQFVDEQTGARFLVLRDGARYEGVPGQRDYQVVSFDVYGLKLDEPTGGYVKEYKEAIPTMDLWASDDPR
ncbi:MAG: LPS export ABC transporter permease LptF, partial [Gammaproteobacteria bacterium]|nr:LPS export ABC transporter permease LptF [Gammaproteobacteria bacterium]